MGYDYYGEYTDEDTPEWDGPVDQDIHRGIGVNLPDDLHMMIHDPRVPAAQRARALHEHVRSHPGGVGVHWTTDPRVGEDFAEHSARGYAHQNAREGRVSPRYGMVAQDQEHGVYTPPPRPASKQGTAVVLHASPPSPHDIDTGIYADPGVYGYHDHGEREVPLHSGELADVKGISWKKVTQDSMDDPDDYESASLG